MPKKYCVTLTPEERSELTARVEKGKSAARTLSHARILLMADQGEGGPARTDTEIVEALSVGLSTVTRVRQAFVETSLDAAIHRRPSSQTRTRKLNGEQEAHLIALICGPAPAGHARWTLRLLASRMVQLEYVASVSHETVRQALKKTS